MFFKFQEDGETFPRCSHGPTILFWKKCKELDGYYACSAYRDLKDCPVKIPFSRAKEFVGDEVFLEYHNGKTVAEKDDLVSGS